MMPGCCTQKVLIDLAIPNELRKSNWSFQVNGKIGRPTSKPRESFDDGPRKERESEGIFLEEPHTVG